MANIEIYKSTGSDNWSPTGEVVMDDNDLITYVVDEEQNNVTINCAVKKGYKDIYYQDVLNCIKEHNTSVVTPINSPISLDFRNLQEVEVDNGGVVETVILPVDTPSNGDGYYLSKINGVEPLNGCFDVVGGPTFRWAPANSGLSITDIARPDVDCIDYIRLSGYVKKIEEAMVECAKQLNDLPMNPQSSTGYYGLYKQYQALRNLWNYLVVRSLVRIAVEYQGDKAYMRAKLTNSTAFTLYVGQLQVKFDTTNYPSGSSVECLFTEAYSFNSNAQPTTWTTSSAKLQSMSSGIWTVTPPSTISVPSDTTVEVTVIFKLTQVLDTSTPPTITISRVDTPWVNQYPTIVSGMVAKPGQLSWEHTHFNPISYPTPTPSGLPPTGDGCTRRFSNGVALAHWGNNVNACKTKPGLYVSLMCKKDGDSVPFNSTNWSAEVSADDDSEGTFSCVFDNGTVKVNFTSSQQGGGSGTVLTVTQTTSHFHEGDGVSVELPAGWNRNDNIINAGLTVPVIMLWTLPSSSLVNQTIIAEKKKNLQVPPNTITNADTLVKRITLNSQLYTVESVRDPSYDISIIDEGDQV